jgi:glycogen operon protein
MRRRHFFRGEPTVKGGPKDLSWIRADGREMNDADWHDSDNQALGMLIYGDATDETDDRGHPIKGETLLLIANGGDVATEFTLPTIDGDGIWAELVDTAVRELRVVTSGAIELAASSLVLLRYGVNRRMADSEAAR